MLLLPVICDWCGKDSERTYSIGVDIENEKMSFAGGSYDLCGDCLEVLDADDSL